MSNPNRAYVSDMVFEANIALENVEFLFRKRCNSNCCSKRRVCKTKFSSSAAGGLSSNHSIVWIPRFSYIDCAAI